MQQYLITVPKTTHATNLLNYIIQTGYFEQIDKIDSEDFEDEMLLEKMIAAKNSGIADKEAILKRLSI